MNVLVINAGSSSIKYQLIQSDTEKLVAKGIVERIDMDGAMISGKVGMDKGEVREFKELMPIKDHVEGMKAVLAALTHADYGAISDLSEIDAVGHRVVHGGEEFSESVLITPAVMDAIRANIDLAPLHNPANIQGIEACRAVLGDVPMVAVFDTAFHQTMPPHAFVYGIPYDYYRRLKVRRYGFHGTSHKYVSRRAAEILGKPIEELKIVTCHLGNGCSIAAIDGGKSVDTSMGLTPLEGVMMGTRSGDIDPAIFDFLSKKEGMTADQVGQMLNKRSGLEGVSEVSSDMRDILKAVDEGNTQARLAYETFCHRVRKYIGAYAAAMGGIDAIVFTAGIGENMWRVRRKIMRGLEFLGVTVDQDKNYMRRGGEIDISTPESTVRVLIVETDEEMAIARDTKRLVGKK